jgi:hypothetical protein
VHTNLSSRSKQFQSFSVDDGTSLSVNVIQKINFFTVKISSYLVIGNSHITGRAVHQIMYLGLGKISRSLKSILVINEFF